MVRSNDLLKPPLQAKLNRERNMLRCVHVRKCQSNRCLLGKYDNQKHQANVSGTKAPLDCRKPFLGECGLNEGALCWQYKEYFQ